MAPDESKQSADAKAEQTKQASELETVLREAMKTATASIERYTDYAIKASKRVVEADAKPEDWSKDAAEVGALWLKDVTNAWSTWTKAVNLLAGRSAAGNDPPQKKDGG
jgi:hypothetical protein